MFSGNQEKSPFYGIPPSFGTEEAYEDWYRERSYSTDELKIILSNPLNISFKGKRYFRENETSKELKNRLLAYLLQPSDEVDTAASKESKVFLDRKRKELPYAMATLFKIGFQNWDIFSFPDGVTPAYLFHTGFNHQLNEFQSSVLDIVKTLMPEKKNERNIFGIVLSPHNEFRCPELTHVVTSAIRRLIGELTSIGLVADAQVLHLFLQTCKRSILETSTDESTLEKDAQLLAMSLRDALKLPADLSLNFLASLLHLNMRESLYDEPYDQVLYTIYHQLDEMSRAYLNPDKSMSVNCVPNLVIRDKSSQLRGYLHEQYRGMIKGLLVAAEPHRDVLSYFQHYVAALCQVNKTELAKDIHHTFYLLSQIYDADPQADVNTEKYGKVIRQLLRLPSTHRRWDDLFDKLAAEAILGNEKHLNHFKVEFDPALYLPFHQHGLQASLLEKTQEILNNVLYRHEKLVERVEDLELQYEDKESNLSISEIKVLTLESKVHALKGQLKGLTLNDEDKSPEKSPETSPSKARKFLNKLSGKAADTAPTKLSVETKSRSGDALLGSIHEEREPVRRAKTLDDLHEEPSAPLSSSPGKSRHVLHMLHHHKTQPEMTAPAIKVDSRTKSSDSLVSSELPRKKTKKRKGSLT